MTTHHPVELSGPLTLRRASELQDLLLSELADRTSIVLSIPADAEIDLSFVQLLESARRHAEAGGKQISLAEPAQDALLTVLDRSGLLTGAAPNDLNFWLHRKEDA